MSQGAARMIDQRELTGERLATEMVALATRRGADARQMARPRASDGAAGCRESDRGPGAELAEGPDPAGSRRGRDARPHAPGALRRHRRHRHERDRRAAGEPRVRGQRLRREAIGRDGAARAEVRNPGASKGTRRQTSATRTSWCSRRRCGRRTRRSSRRSARGIPVIPARRDARRADAAALCDRRCRLARQDDDDVDDRAGAGAGRDSIRRR